MHTCIGMYNSGILNMTGQCYAVKTADPLSLEMSMLEQERALFEQYKAVLNLDICDHRQMSLG